MSIVLLFCFVYLLIITLFLTVLLFFSKKHQDVELRLSNPSKNEFAVLIPAYKEDLVILDSVKNVLDKNKNYENFKIIVIGQHLHCQTVHDLKNMDKVVCVEYNKTPSSKTRAIQHAIKELPYFYPNYTHALVLDADNHLEEGFLEKLNTHALYSDLIQVHRVAKEIETPFQLVDAMAEELNNTLFRKGHSGMNLSVITIGSGMCMERNLFEKYHTKLYKLDVFSGWDRELEFLLLEDGHQFHYVEDLKVLDEKVSSGASFQKQRTRWLFAQFNDLKKLGKAFKLGFYGNIDYFNRALQALMLPRLLLIALFAICFLASLFYDWSYTVGFGILTLSYITICFLGIPKYLRTRDRLKTAIIAIPKAIIRMLGSLVNINKAKGKFIHTEHGK